ncbi:MAG: LemA family protein [Treponemataceae bacterium]|nr:LemA family protein [Treponemataceae bacterium]
MVGIIVIAVVVLILLWALATYNKLVKGKNLCEEGFSTMDVYLKKRFDLIPNLVATVKGYAKHEAETLEKVIAARNNNMNASTEARLEDEKRISEAVKNINIVAEQYPDLKANQNFIDLQKQLQSLEEDIANSRKYYNGCVREFNNMVMMVPSNIIAGIGHFTKQPLYEVDDASERKNVKVEF